MNVVQKRVGGVLVEYLINGVKQPLSVNSKLNLEVLKPEWPLLLRPMKLLAQPGDKGLGDIVERTIGPVGGDAYKIWYKTTFGKPCKCNKRQDNLNERYPL